MFSEKQAKLFTKHSRVFTTLKERKFENNVGKEENAGYPEGQDF